MVSPGWSAFTGWHPPPLFLDTQSKAEGLAPFCPAVKPFRKGHIAG